MYDGRAESLTTSFAEGDFRVTGAEIGPGVLLAVGAVNGSDSIRLEVISVSSGPKVESWRLFATDKRSEHYVYPEGPVATEQCTRRKGLSEALGADTRGCSSASGSSPA
jgi:hypothetical protein